jgi:hypothetical protein
MTDEIVEAINLSIYRLKQEIEAFKSVVNDLETRLEKIEFSHTKTSENKAKRSGKSKPAASIE